MECDNVADNIDGIVHKQRTIVNSASTKFLKHQIYWNIELVQNNNQKVLLHKNKLDLEFCVLNKSNCRGPSAMPCKQSLTYILEALSPFFKYYYSSLCEYFRSIVSHQ